jgi:hypothetical protein
LANLMLCRHAICAERRRSSAMERCLNVRIASITRRNASSHKLKRRGIHRRGTSLQTSKAETQC